MCKSKILFLILGLLLPTAAFKVGAAATIDWPKDAAVELKLELSTMVATNGQVKITGDLLIKNPGTAPLTIQSPQNRLTLAFVVFDPLGNPVAPTFIGKADPAFQTHTMSPQGTYTHHFETLDFVTGSALLTYNLPPGKTYRVVAVYRPAGQRGPGFTTQETKLEIPKAGSQGKLETDH